MSFKIPCPHCDRSLKVRDEQSGKKCRCPYCKTAFVIPENVAPPVAPKKRRAPSADLVDSSTDDDFYDEEDFEFSEYESQSGSGEASGKSHRNKPSKLKKKTGNDSKQSKATEVSNHSSDGADVGLVESGVIGLLLTIITFTGLELLARYDYRLGHMFCNSVGINFPTTLLMFWSFAILYLKSKQLTKQKSALMLDLLPSELSQEITASSLDGFVKGINSLPQESRDSFLVNRVLRGIEHFRVRRNAAETVTMMESQSAIDAAKVAGSYTVIKVFIWAMPILGFIGTVMGVSSAVAGLSATLENAADVSAVTESMKGVFGGLGTAFDTTLIALIMSMLVKIPASVMQKSEDGLVTIVDEYCNENLLRRLNDELEGGAERGSGTGSAADARIFRQAVEAAMGTHHAELENWLAKLDAIGSKLTSQVANGWSQINATVMEQQQEQLGEFQSQLAEMGASATGIQKAMADLSSQAAALQDNVAKSVSGSTEVMEVQFAGIERGLTGLTGVLESLGEQQVVVQQVEPQRRGWFGRK